MGGKKTDHDLGGVREWRSERSGFPLRGGEEGRYSERGSEGKEFIHGRLVQVRCLCNSKRLNSGASFGRILEWKQRNLEEPGHYCSFQGTRVPTSMADRAESTPVHEISIMSILFKTFCGHAVMEGTP